MVVPRTFGRGHGRGTWFSNCFGAGFGSESKVW